MWVATLSAGPSGSAINASYRSAEVCHKKSIPVFLLMLLFLYLVELEAWLSEDCYVRTESLLCDTLEQDNLHNAFFPHRPNEC